ncbi:hypothetical protein [Streptomyces sp. NPDC050416]|uniref:hypothetical protein n=1 Tax=Streptomyces sp. NPDC050416 TaxID=3365611 RepID=UPI0037A568A1
MHEEPERYRVEFASGTAASVAKRRSFRDRERNDIEPDLPGWPPGRSFAVRGFFGKLGRYVQTVVTGLLMLPLHIIADALGSPASPEKRGKPEERENEVDDFPVMWAGMGETARTLPWQLDPSRRPWRMVTEIELAESEGLVRILSHEDTAVAIGSFHGAAARRFRDPRPCSGRCPGRTSSARRSNRSPWPSPTSRSPSAMVPGPG